MNQLGNELPPPPPVRIASTQQYSLRLSDPIQVNGDPTRSTTTTKADSRPYQPSMQHNIGNSDTTTDKALPDPPVKEKSKKPFKVFNKKSKLSKLITIFAFFDRWTFQMVSNKPEVAIIKWKIKQEAQHRCDIFRRRWVRKGSKVKWLKISRRS